MKRENELLRTLWGFRREFVVVGIFSMVANLLLLVPTLYMLQIYDRVTVSRSELTLLAASLITLFLLAVMAFAEWSRSRLLVRAGVRLDQQLCTRVFNASYAAYLHPADADPVRAFPDLTEIRQFLTGTGIFALFDTPWVPIYISVLFFLHPWLGFLALCFALVQAVLAWFGHRNSIAPAEAASLAQSDANSYLQSKLRNVEVIEAMGMRDTLRQRWNRRHQTMLALNTRALGVSHRIAAWSKFIRYSQQSLVLGAGALLVIDGQLSAGAMIAANVLMSRALAPIDLLVTTWRSFIGAKAAFGRLDALLKAHPEPQKEQSLTLAAEIKNDSCLRSFDKHLGLIRLENVVATAAGRVTPILHGLSLDLPTGSVTVVLGASGSGKSTLARVLVGIWPTVSGEVLLGGRPITQWLRTEIGPQLGYLPQDIELFDGSIAENIARFNTVDPTLVIAAAKTTGLHELILRFPKGYDTAMGEAGNLLSGGQRQRIALARALYGEPSLIVLDEPNANLDDAGETALQKAVLGLKAQGKTVVLISHGSKAIAVADQLLVLHAGRVQAYGPRDTVLEGLKAGKSASSSPPQPPSLPSPSGGKSKHPSQHPSLYPSQESPTP